VTGEEQAFCGWLIGHLSFDFAFLGRGMQPNRRSVVIQLEAKQGITFNPD
jgi:hypothetical protein